MPNYMIEGQTLTDIADAIRAKTGSSDPITGANMASEIENIPSGGDESYSNELWKSVLSDLTTVYTGSSYTLTDLITAYDGGEILKYVRIPVCNTIGGSTPDGYIYIFSDYKNAVEGRDSALNGSTGRFILQRHQYTTNLTASLVEDSTDHYIYTICIRPNQVFFGKRLSKGTNKLNINWKLGPYASETDIDYVYKGNAVMYTKLVGDDMDVDVFIYSNNIVAKGKNYIVDYDGRCFYYPTTT